ncbi:MAG TPA: hypothetical protein VK540_33495 [Polyangiaceae bacterium]|jgi:hypothetical protein|nr:hypothetical protein [Polyangiaceae bacterium]
MAACKACERDDELRLVLLDLQRAHQRATSGVVAEHLGGERTATNLMNGHTKDHLHSWVVAVESGLPSEYAPAERHPELKKDSRVINDKQDLKRRLDGINS